MNDSTRDQIVAAITIARQILRRNYPLGRLCIASMAHSARDSERTQGASHYNHLPANQGRHARLIKVAAVFESEQRAMGFAVGLGELEAAEAQVAPVPVERLANEGHGSNVALLSDDVPRTVEGASFGVRAEHRADSRWHGAYVNCSMRVGDHHWQVLRAPAGEGAEGIAAAHDAAALFVGRYAALGQEILREVVVATTSAETVNFYRGMRLFALRASLQLVMSWVRDARNRAEKMREISPDHETLADYHRAEGGAQPDDAICNVPVLDLAREADRAAAEAERSALFLQWLIDERERCVPGPFPTANELDRVTDPELERLRDLYASAPLTSTPRHAATDKALEAKGWVTLEVVQLDGEPDATVANLSAACCFVGDDGRSRSTLYDDGGLVRECWRA